MQIRPSAPLTVVAGSISIDTSPVTLPAGLEGTIHNVIASRPAPVLPGTSFRLTAARSEGEWALVALDVIDEGSETNEYLSFGERGSVILARRAAPGVWEAALRDTAPFDALLEKTPESFIAAADRPAFRPNSPTASPAQAIEYRFPWLAGVNGWLTSYRNPMWHGAMGGGAAIDMFYMGDRRVLASTGGVVTNLCIGTVSVNLSIRDDAGLTMGYAHLEKAGFDTKLLGQRVGRGQVLGQLKPGTWTDTTCKSYTEQGSSNAHIHWSVPQDPALVVDGWTLDYPTNYLERDGVRKGPNSYFASSNQLYAPPYRGEYVSQGFQSTMTAGTTQQASITLRNTGTATWDSNTRLAAVPRDQASPFYDPSWLAPNRIVAAGSTAPGGSHTFTFTLRAPSAPGQYMLKFGVIQEGWSWLAEPGEGSIWFPITVVSSDPMQCADSFSVGAGSSRQQAFVDAYNRHGGRVGLGCTLDGAAWTSAPSSDQRIVVQHFTGNTPGHTASIYHDEQRDQPTLSVPAYVVRGGILQHYLSLGEAGSWLGPPTSDEFVNERGLPQSNFRNGYIEWENGAGKAHSWPTSNGQWRVEYFNGTNLNAYPTWVANDDGPSQRWQYTAPGNDQWGVWADKYVARWTRRVEFEAGTYTFTASADERVRVLLDGDEIMSASLQETSVERTLTAGEHEVRVEYAEDTGVASVVVGWMRQQELVCTMTINDGAVFTNRRDVQVKLNVPNAAVAVLSNDGGFGAPTSVDYQPSLPWELRDPGTRPATLVVYGRFQAQNGAALCGQTGLSDDIFYDPLPPAVTITGVTTVGGAALSAAVASAQVAVRTSAADQADGSGLSDIQISTRPDFADVEWTPYAESMVVSLTGERVYVRVRDLAGNVSATASRALAQEYRLYLPVLLK